MSDSELDAGLASPTLAQLYLEQGHADRARAICEDVLERDPTNGYALVLEQRLQAQTSARLEARFVSDSAAGINVGLGWLELSWMVPRRLLDGYDDPRLDVVVALAVAREIEGLRYTSVRCRDLKASVRFDVPPGPASAAVALLLSAGPRRHRPLAEPSRRPQLRVLAVADPPSW